MFLEVSRWFQKDVHVSRSFRNLDGSRRMWIFLEVSGMGYVKSCLEASLL